MDANLKKLFTTKTPRHEDLLQQPFDEWRDCLLEMDFCAQVICFSQEYRSGKVEANA